MSRIRYLKPTFFTSDNVAALPPLVRLLFQGLWCLADRQGLLLDRPARIRVEVMPYDKINIEAALATLQEREFICRYVVDGTAMIHVSKFHLHQKPHHKEPLSTLHPCPMHESSTTHVSTVHEPSTVDDASRARAGVTIKGTLKVDGQQEGDGEPRFAAPQPPPGDAIGDLFYRHFGHEATKQQRDELETFIALHGQPCVDWVLSEVGGAALEKRTWRNVRFKFGDCGEKGHGPRANVGAGQGGRSVRAAVGPAVDPAFDKYT